MAIKITHAVIETGKDNWDLLKTEFDGPGGQNPEIAAVVVSGVTSQLFPLWQSHYLKRIFWIKIFVTDGKNQPLTGLKPSAFTVSFDAGPRQKLVPKTVCQKIFSMETDQIGTYRIIYAVNSIKPEKPSSTVKVTKNKNSIMAPLTWI